MHIMGSLPSLPLPLWSTVVLLVWISLAHAHTVITYPGYRGNNLITNGTVEEANGLGIARPNDSYIYPFGMQWMYPCGGMPTSTNRTKWPVKGGAVAFQPGWFPGHSTAFVYVNLGLGTVPENISLPMVSVFAIFGPSDEPYPGTVCLPQVSLPAGVSPKVGDNATIQVVLAAQHGASLYNCVDIEFAEPKDVAEVTRDNCFNSSKSISFGHVFTTSSLSEAASLLRLSRNSIVATLPLLAAAMLLL